MLAEVKLAADVVILDTAPVTTSLGVGAVGLADGVVVVANVALVRRPMLDQLADTLAELGTPRFGLVLMGVKRRRP